MLLPDIIQSPSSPTWLQAARNTPSRHQKGRQKRRRELMKLVCPHVMRAPKQLFTGAEAGSRPACLLSRPSEVVRNRRPLIR
jgi:hypothetical protein